MSLYLTLSPPKLAGSCEIFITSIFCICVSKEAVIDPPKPNVFNRFSNFINAVKELEENQKEEEEPEKKTPEGKPFILHDSERKLDLYKVEH